MVRYQHNDQAISTTSRNMTAKAHSTVMTRLFITCLHVMSTTTVAVVIGLWAL
jgi:hypothetical protein